MVAAMLPGAVVSTVNLSEVVARLAEGGMSEVAIRQDLDGLGLELVPFGVEQAYTAGLLRPLTRHLGLSLGDRACLSLAQQLGVPAFTTDGAWAELNVGIDVRLVR
jgi:PIN domain nuclease of toxin-antitoxin system